MKPDDEPEFSHSTLDYIHDSKSFENDKNAFDVSDQNVITKQNQDGSYCELKDCEKDTNMFASEIKDNGRFPNTSQLECDMVFDEKSKSDEDESGEPVTFYTIPSSKIELLEKETEFYTDKNIMECELPKSIVAIKESTDYVVKDICIDEGVPSENKMVIKNANDEHDGNFTLQPSSGDENVDIDKGVPSEEKIPNERDKDEQKDYFNSKPCNGDNINDITKERVETELVISDALTYSHGEYKTPEKVDIELLYPKPLKSSSEDGSDKYQAKESDYLDSMPEIAGNFDAAVNNVDYVQNETFVPDRMLVVQDLSQQDLCKSVDESSDHNINENRDFSNQVQDSDLNSEIPDLASKADESNKSTSANDIFYNSKVESGTITFDFNSASPTSSSREESPNMVDHEQPEESNNVVKDDKEETSDTSTASSRVHHFHGESSFSASHSVSSGFIPYSGSIAYSGSIDDSGRIPFSGSIADSGPIPFSGSISHRSDASTTSARSFAFPVLNTEWNSSPVRMAKADRRHYRKHGGWKQGLLCCRF